MFDPSFFELIIICVVALLVLGPDRLPGAIKTLGLWIGRLRRSFNNIKREIEQEVGADEIRRQLRNEAIMEKFNTTKSQITESIDSVKSEAESIKNDLNLSKELSTDETSNTTSANPGSVDPLEKLATSDPAARIIKPDNSQNTGEVKTPSPEAENANDSVPQPASSSLSDETDGSEKTDQPEK